MRTYHSATATLCLLLLLATTAPAQEMEMAPETSQLAVAELVITTNVQDRQPVDALTNVAADIGQVYCWSRITGAEGETRVEHVWYHGENEMARVPLTIGGSNWRTWTSKNIVPEWTGEWRVDVVGPEGTVLDSVAFTVQ